MKIIKGQFVSVWDDGSVTSYAELNLDTGEVINIETLDGAEIHGCLLREYFEDQDGNTYDVCTTCHEYTLKASMVPDQTGKGLHEEKVCVNPDCESHEE